MGTIQINCNDTVEPYVMDADSEVGIRIVDIRQATNVNGAEYILPRFEVVDELAAKEFGYYLGLPNDSMTSKQLNASKFKYASFLTALGLDPNDEHDPEDWIGLEAVAILGLEESAEYGEQNYIKRFVVGA